jgi:hypothetical protein
MKALCNRDRGKVERYSSVSTRTAIVVDPFASRCVVSALPNFPGRVQDQFLLQQWRKIEDMLVERGAVDTGNA